MLEKFYPDEYVDSTYAIDFEDWCAKGYRGVLFDIDNTLVPHGAPADERAVEFFEKLRATGFQYCLISNNQLPRVQPFAEAVQAYYIEDAHKPLGKRLPESNGAHGDNFAEHAVCGRSAFYRCLRRKARRHQKYSCKADPSERGNPDRAQALPGEDRAVLLREEKEERAMNHIILIGFMGAGKTSVGEGHCERNGACFCRHRQRIEAQQQKKINDIFAQHGEAYFRDLETDMLKAASK